MSDEVELSVQGEIAFVRLRRPDRGNALGAATFAGLRKVGLRLADTPPRFVVLAGEGADFCVGLDPDAEDPLYRHLEPVVRARDAHRAQEVVKQLRGSLDAFARLPCPVVAAIEGRCHGAGLELALMADLRVAAEGATLRAGEQRLGVITGLGGLVRLAALVGPARTTDLVLTGRALDLDAAVAIGLVARSAPAGGALGAALDLVHELRRTAATARLQALLATRAIGARLGAELVDQESQAAARSWVAGDWITGLAAIRDGQEPSA